jgi:hypothetical protein
MDKDLHDGGHDSSWLSLSEKSLVFIYSHRHRIRIEVEGESGGLLVYLLPLATRHC